MSRFNLVLAANEEFGDACRDPICENAHDQRPHDLATAKAEAIAEKRLSAGGKPPVAMDSLHYTGSGRLPVVVWHLLLS